MVLLNNMHIDIMGHTYKSIIKRAIIASSVFVVTALILPGTVLAGGGGNNPPDSPDFTVGPIAGENNVSVTFEVQAWDIDNDDIRYQIDYLMDGNVNQIVPTPDNDVNSGDEQTFTHTWISNGPKTFQVRTIDEDDMVSGWTEHTIFISNPLPPIVVLTADSLSIPYDTQPSLTWTITGNVDTCIATNDPSENEGWSDIPGGPDVSGGTADPDMIDNSPAINTYYLECFNVGVSSGVESVNIFVEAPNALGNIPTPPLVIGPTSGYVGIMYNFTLSSTDPSGEDVQFGFDWDDDNNVDPGDWTAFASSGDAMIWPKSWPTTGLKTLHIVSRNRLSNVVSEPSTPQTVEFLNIDEFELDGNAITDNPSFKDWDQINDATRRFQTNTLAQFMQDPSPNSIFSGGGSKDTNDLTDWGWKEGNVPDKSDITTAYSFAVQRGLGVIPNTYDVDIYFGVDRYSNNGNAQLAFWFFKDDVSVNEDGSFNGVHQPEDMLVLVDYSAGSPLVQIYFWDTSETNNLRLQSSTLIGNVCSFDGVTPCVKTNESPINVTWPYTGKGGDLLPQQHNFIEGGYVTINVPKASNNDITKKGYYAGALPPYRTFLVESRSSSAINAGLEDFSLMGLRSRVVEEFGWTTHTVMIAESLTPLVSLVASVNPVFEGDTPELVWSIYNGTAQNCTSTAATPTSTVWVDGAAITAGSGGSTTTEPIFADTTYDIECDWLGAGVFNDSLEVTVLPVPPAPPVVTLDALDNPIAYGTTTELSWTVVGADICSAWTVPTANQGSWVGNKATATPPYSEYPGNINSQTAYALTCYGPGGATTQGDTVDVDAEDPITIALTADLTNIAYGGTTTLRWNEPEAAICYTTAGPWLTPGALPTVGSQGTGQLITNASYQMTCENESGVRANADEDIFAGAAADVVMDLTASPDNPIDYNATTTLTWTTTNAVSCTASSNTGAWSGAKVVNGILVTGALTEEHQYKLTCYNASGVPNSREFNVQIAPPEITYINYTPQPPVQIPYSSVPSIVYTVTSAASCTPTEGTAIWAGLSLSATGGTYSAGTSLGFDTDFTITCSNPITGPSAASTTNVQVAPPQCDNSDVDDDSDGATRTDTNDPGCHSDWDVTNPGSYVPTDDDEGDEPQCVNILDDDSDGYINAADPGCWADPEDNSTYDRGLDSENNCGNGFCETDHGESMGTCSLDCHFRWKETDGS